eukprot:snap_masked-scaffold_50-processed-gene-1.78-mRNA-1 protein AED:0.08 eAED:1.00 QI:0/0/0/1/1/1/2/0/411
MNVEDVARGKLLEEEITLKDTYSTKKTSKKKLLLLYKIQETFRTSKVEFPLSPDENEKKDDPYISSTQKTKPETSKLEKKIVPFNTSSFVFAKTSTNSGFTNENYEEIYKRSSFSKNSLNGSLLEYNSLAIELDFLITGVGRSGTTFLVEEFKNLNIKISHDNSMNQADKIKGSASWPNAFNEKYCRRESWNFPKVKIIRYKHIFHIIRNPLRQINSRADGGKFANILFSSIICNTDIFNGYNFSNLPDHEKRKKFVKDMESKGFSKFEASLKLALRHWVLYNSFISSYAEFTFRIEDLDNPKQKEEILKKIINSAEIKDKPTEEVWEEFRKKQVDEHTNSGHTRKIENFKLTWETLDTLDAEFSLMAKIMSFKFGYLTNPKEIDIIQESKKYLDCYFNTEKKWTCEILSS